MSITSGATLAKKFLSRKHRQTYRQVNRQTDRLIFSRNSPIGHPKTCKSMKSRKSKIFTKPILSSIYIKERKKIKNINLLLIKPFFFTSINQEIFINREIHIVIQGYKMVYVHSSTNFLKLLRSFS